MCDPASPRLSARVTLASEAKFQKIIIIIIVIIIIIIINKATVIKKSSHSIQS